MANGHSHNDYEHALPFYDAYARHYGSIEADVWAVNDTLYVAHGRDQIAADRTFRNLYLDPLITRLGVTDGRLYKNEQPLQLLIDLKSSYKKVLPLLKKALQPYRKYFDSTHHSYAVRIVISGNMPPPDSLDKFDTIFTFDGRLGNHYPEQELRRITLVSANIENLISWESDDTLNTAQQNRLHQVIDSVHHEGKLIRFWATPNTNYAYESLMELGVDYVNVDSLAKFECLIRSKNKDY